MQEFKTLAQASIGRELSRVAKPGVLPLRHEDGLSMAIRNEEEASAFLAEVKAAVEQGE